jgi:hypothetical protein
MILGLCTMHNAWGEVLLHQPPHPLGIDDPPLPPQRRRNPPVSVKPVRQ